MENSKAVWQRKDRKKGYACSITQHNAMRALPSQLVSDVTHALLTVGVG